MMPSITGFLIRYHRLKKNISQEGLCKGICVVSYLSKIEQGQVNASEDIIQQLFQVLDVAYCEDAAFLEHYQKQLHAFFSGYFLREDITEIQEELLSVQEKLLNSPLCISMLLAQLCFACIEDNEEKTRSKRKELHVFKHLMKDDQLFLYHLLSGYCKPKVERIAEFEKAGEYKVCSLQKHGLGYAYYYCGRIGEAIDCLKRSYELACEEGNAYMMLEAALTLGNCYCVSGELRLMKTYYNICEMLARTMHREDYSAVIQYNIGTTYIESNQLPEAERYLRNSLLQETKMECDELLVYQKLALVYAAMRDQKQAKECLAKADERFDDSRNEIDTVIHHFIHLYCDEATRYSDACIQTLEDICFGKFDESYGLRSFYARYLYELYVARRRYKDALYITSKIKQNISYNL